MQNIFWLVCTTCMRPDRSANVWYRVGEIAWDTVFDVFTVELVNLGGMFRIVIHGCIFERLEQLPFLTPSLIPPDFPIYY